MNNRDERTKLLKSLLDERILVLDGAMGTMIQQRNLVADDFGGAALVLNEYALTDKCHAINVAAATLARRAAEEFSTPNKPRFVAASIGPTTKAITVTGGVTFDQLIDNFFQQVRGVAEGG